MKHETDILEVSFAPLFGRFVKSGGFPLDVVQGSVTLCFPTEDDVQAWSLARWHLERDVVSLVVWCDPQEAGDVVKDICGLAVWFAHVADALRKRHMMGQTLRMDNLANMLVAPRGVIMEGGNAVAWHILGLSNDERFRPVPLVDCLALAAEFDAWSSILRRAAFSWRVWIFLNIRRLLNRFKTQRKT